MADPRSDDPTKLSHDVVEVLKGLAGEHAGYRPVHAKGMMFTGTFTPADGAAGLTRAPHAHASSTPVTVRFSDAGGVPTVADNDPAGGVPRGIAVRFHLGAHVHTDIIAHSRNGFPVRTGEEFVELLKAIALAKAATPNPSPLGAFLGSHPAAAAFVSTPPYFPTSFARDTYFAVTAFRFTNASGAEALGRFRIVPEDGNEVLSEADAAAKPANYLFDEIAERVASGPVRLRVVVQVAASGDAVDDATSLWPEDRPQVVFGTVTLIERVADGEVEHDRIIFDPVPRVEGIESAGDPLTAVRSGAYVLSGRQRRKASAAQRATGSER